jgi:RHS repeat-associated protein
LNELIEEDNQVLDKTVVYSYDEGGNITQKRETRHDTGAQTVFAYSYDNTWKDKLVNYNGKQITYDGIGNPLTYDGYTYTWEEGRQLKSITGNSKSISFKYNDAGIRTEKAADGVVTKYYITGRKINFEDNGTDSIYYTYDDQGDLISMNLKGEEYYYIRNGQKDIIGLFDSNAVQVVSYLYDSWGRLVSIKDQDGTDVTGNADHVGYKNPYRYRGYRYDSETGLYYLNSRYYNPEWGRYLNTDAAAGKTGVLLSHNLFAYSMNNPVNMEDVNGYWPGWLRRAAAAVKRVFNRIVRAVTRVVAAVKKAVSNVASRAAKVYYSIRPSNKQVKSVVGSTAVAGIEEGISSSLEKVPEHISLQTNRAMRRAGEQLIIPVRVAGIARGISSVEKIGAAGLASTGISVWDNFHSGYSSSEAWRRTEIDVGAATIGIGVGLSTISFGWAIGITFLLGTASEIMKN